MKRHSSEYGSAAAPQRHKVVTFRAIRRRAIIDLRNHIIRQFRVRAGNAAEGSHFKHIQSAIGRNGGKKGQVIGQ